MEHQVQQITNLLIQIVPEAQLSDLEPIYRRRLEIAVRTHLGQSQAEICSALGCSKDTARHWMTIAKTEGLSSWYSKPIGRPQRVDEEYKQRLRELVRSSPKEHGYAFKRWTASWLSKQLAKELGIEISDRHVNRLLKQMGLSTRKSCATESSQAEIRGQSIVIRDLNPAVLS
jgi:transposase